MTTNTDQVRAQGGLDEGGHYWRECAEFWRAQAVALGWRVGAPPSAGEVPPEDRFEQFVQAEIARSPNALRELGCYLADVLDEDRFPRANRLLLQLATEYAPPSAPVDIQPMQRGGGDPANPRDDSDRYCDHCPAGELASAPPSSPVGVEWLAERAAQLYEAATSAGATHEQALHEAIEHALAQQPAAPSGEAWRPMETAPRDGTIVRLLVEFTDHALEDTDQAIWTIGHNNLAHDGEDLWQFAGWCWEHDHYTSGEGTPIGWLPLLDTAPQQPAAVDGAMPVLVELVATLAATGTVTGGRIYFPERQTRELLKRACDALAAQQQGGAA